MATSVQIRTPTYIDGLTYAGQDDRLHTGLLLSGLGGASGNPIGTGSGVRDATGNPLQVSVTSGLSVQVNAGAAAIQGSAALNAGVYTAESDTTVTLTCTAADTVNPRIDSVCMTVTDNGDATSTADIQIIAGTPASSPSAPSLPANSLLLCNITVPANAVTLVSGNLSDQRTFIAAAGGIKPVLNSGFYPTVGSSAMYMHDISTGRLLWAPNGSVFAPRTAPFADVWSGIISSTTVSSTTYVSVCSVTVTVDGHTSVNLTASWGWVGATAAVGNACNLSIFRGTGEVNGIALVSQAANVAISGGSWVYQDVTPAAGTYTYALKISNQGAGSYTLHTASLLAQAAHP